MKNVVYTFFLLLLVSCFSQKKPKKPDNLISKDKMVYILIDMSVYSSAKGVNKKVLEINGVKLQDQIYKKYHIDSTQFAESNYYYTYFPEEYEDIYIQVRDSLTKLKTAFTAIDILESKEKKIRDSIKRAEIKLSPQEVRSKETLMNDALSKKNRNTPVKSE